MGVTGLIHFNHIAKEGITSWQDLNAGAWKPNYGDMLVCSAILRQVKTERTVQCNFGHGLKEPVDLAVLRGSTYLSNEMKFEDAITTIDSIKAPIACVGLGAQSPVSDVKFLDGNPLARRFIEKLAEKSKSISVRGQFTADVIARLGAKNIRVTGCPSMFYSLGVQEILLPETLSTENRRLGVSIHTGLGSRIFCRDPRLALKRHGETIRFCLENSQSTRIFEQGIPAEYIISDRRESFAKRVEATQTILRRIGLEGAYPPEQFMGYFSSLHSIEEWLGKVRDVDAMIGFRFHGNMVGLSQGIASFFYTYDSRLEEFCQIYALPYAAIEEEWANPIDGILKHDWSKTNAAIRSCLKELTLFYAENGVPTRLTMPAAAAA